MAREDSWRENRRWDFAREAREMERRPDYGQADPGYDDRYRDYRRWADRRNGEDRYRGEPDGSGYEDERAYRPYGSSGPTAYYAEPPYRYGAPRAFTPYGMGAAPYDRRRAEEPRSWMNKASDEVASWFGDRDAERRRRADEMRAGHRGRGPKGYRRSDERMTEDVNDRLTEDPYLDATDIAVAVEAGEVTLSGHVASREDKRRAERLAEDVSGVGDVQNNLRVRPTEGPAATAGTPVPGNF
jgi:osmotically-inducible protein OsmY